MTCWFVTGKHISNPYCMVIKAHPVYDMKRRLEVLLRRCIRLL